MKERFNFRGNLDTTLTFLRPPANIQKSPLGNVISQPLEEAFTRRSMLLYLSGEELIEAQQLSSKVRVKIVIRKDAETSEIDSNWSIKYKAKTYDVEYITTKPAGQRATRLEIFCQERGL